MAQSQHIDSYGPSTNLPFGICAIYLNLKVHPPPFGICHDCSSLASISASTGAKGAGTLALPGATEGPVPGRGSKWLWPLNRCHEVVKVELNIQYSWFMLPLLSWCGKVVPSSLTWLRGETCLKRLQPSSELHKDYRKNRAFLYWLNKLNVYKMPSNDESINFRLLLLLFSSSDFTSCPFQWMIFQSSSSTHTPTHAEHLAPERNFEPDVSSKEQLHSLPPGRIHGIQVQWATSIVECSGQGLNQNRHSMYFWVRKLYQGFGVAEMVSLRQRCFGKQLQ